MRTPNLLTSVIALVGAVVFAGSVFAGSWKALTPAEMVENYPLIVTGKVVLVEKREVVEGVYVVTHYVQVGEVLQGEPVRREVTWAGQDPIKTVAFKTLDGPKATSRKFSFPVGEEGVWLLTPSKEATDAVVYNTCPQRGEAAKLKELIAAKRVAKEFGAIGDEPKTAVTPIKAVRRDAPYQAYWLTPAKDGERAEYQCLLVTHGSVEQLAGHKAWSALPFDNMAMTFQTYKRDSLWDHPFVCVQQFNEVDAKAKTVIVDKVTYAYESCPLRDVVQLLENPTGKIAIHRRVGPLTGAESTAKAFRFLLQEQLKAEK